MLVSRPMLPMKRLIDVVEEHLVAAGARVVGHFASTSSQAIIVQYADRRYEVRVTPQREPTATPPAPEGEEWL